jgi:hypothetical protein
MSASASISAPLSSEVPAMSGSIATFLARVASRCTERSDCRVFFVASLVKASPNWRLLCAPAPPATHDRREPLPCRVSSRKALGVGRFAAPAPPEKDRLGPNFHRSLPTRLVGLHIVEDGATDRLPFEFLGRLEAVRTWPAMPREKAQAAPTARPKVPMRRRGADCPVVVMKRGTPIRVIII